MTRRFLRPSIRAAGALLVLLLAGPALGEPVGDEQSRLLEVRRWQIELSSARADMARAEELFAEGLVSQAEMERQKARVAGAQLSYQQAVLSLLSVEPRVTVQRAVKERFADGRRSVNLTVVNLTPTFDDEQFRMLDNFEGGDPLPDSLRTRDLRDVFVSLKNAGETDQLGRLLQRGTTIGLPYEVHMDELPYGQPRTLRFELLRDVDSVLVSVTYKGQIQEIDLQLEQGQSDRAATVSSAQLSQEADLGSQARYALRLERSTVDQRNLQLRVLGLPRQISYSFIDPGTEARLTQLQFPPGVTHQDLGLRLHLPERADDEVPLDEPLGFWVAALEADEAERLDEEAPDPEALAASQAGLLRLELVARGTGRIELSAPTLFSEVRRGEPVVTTLLVRNTGSRRLDNVHTAVDAPPGWRVEVAPEHLPSLPMRQERELGLRVEAPPDVPVGDYELRIRTDGTTGDRRLPPEEKIYRISIQARSKMGALTTTLGLLVLLVVGVVVGGMRLARR